MIKAGNGAQAHPQLIQLGDDQGGDVNGLGRELDPCLSSRYRSAFD
jgi:hypothetical protein